MDSPSGSTAGVHPTGRIIFLLARLSPPLLSDTYFLSRVSGQSSGARDHFGSSRCVMCPRESPLDFAVLTMIDRRGDLFSHKSLVSIDSPCLLLLYPIGARGPSLVTCLLGYSIVTVRSPPVQRIETTKGGPFFRSSRYERGLG